MDLPRIAITMGDPAGVGPETIVGVWSRPEIHAVCRPCAVGHPQVLLRAVDLLGTQVRVIEVKNVGEAAPSPGVLPVVNACAASAAEVPPGAIDPRGGQAAFDALVAAAQMALRGEVAAITTAPLHKAALHAAGHHYPGHTELLAELCGVQDFAMMLYLGPNEKLRSPHGLGIVHVTLHMALRDVFQNLTPDAILVKARLVNQIMRRLMSRSDSGPPSPAPRIGVCALNPHAGEEGLFGDEEQRIIRLAVERGISEGLALTGPLPTDTLMLRAKEGEFDAVVAMYHDQGHIAIKLLGMHSAVNITLGLPIVRTSVAHGTAFDLAWKGTAETSGMIEAIKVAAKLGRQLTMDNGSVAALRCQLSIVNLDAARSDS